MILCLPFVMFQGRAQEAIDYYLETFPDAELLEIIHHPEGTQIHDPHAGEQNTATAETEAPGSDDTAAMETVVNLEQTLVATAQLRIGGQMLMIQDALVKQPFDFSPSVSIAVVVDTEEEFHSIVEKLSAGGTFLMEPGDYEFAKNFTWVTDQFGVSWQVNQPANRPDPEADTAGDETGGDAGEDPASAQPPHWG
ncbi:VOC family protein [Nesterenkonia alba]|uniref:VOC family protein n=1 Tax=Nesterenkonia alba TaxID=515814 RepID=UPI0003B73FA7|nr:VOC family protein [Nesterenkonia alba]